MSDFQKFRKKAQGGRIKSLSEDYFRYFSIYLTWLFVRTPLTGNQITFIWILFGFASVISFAIGGYKFVLLGGFLYFMRHTLDRVDGEVARYRGQQSIKGKIYDLCGHWLYEPLLFIGVAIGFFRTTGQWWLFIPAFFALYGYYLTDVINLAISVHKPKTKIIVSKHQPVQEDIKVKMYLFLRKLFLLDYFHVVLLICAIFNVMWLFVIINFIGFNFVWFVRLMSLIFRE